MDASDKVNKITASINLQLDASQQFPANVESITAKASKSYELIKPTVGAAKRMEQFSEGMAKTVERSKV